MFQFQYGAIWRWLTTLHNPKLKLVSIPVWCDLENKDKLVAKFDITSFNSSMVRFGVIHSLNLIAWSVCFNSSMVRFGVVSLSD